ncbi:unnamed protein product [Thlaspi arvense]|uniref:Uncharacterized protein n=1 Tax=Thlaspi arvense TaxID=13288 RepID=A0AAU9SLD4_THLAR|nr:unnamed protein product [Thlaspi arvense]
MSAAISVFPSTAGRASAAASRFSTVRKPKPASPQSAFRMPKQSLFSNRILRGFALIRLLLSLRLSVMTTRSDSNECLGKEAQMSLGSRLHSRGLEGERRRIERNCKNSPKKLRQSGIPSRWNIFVISGQKTEELSSQYRWCTPSLHKLQLPALNFTIKALQKCRVGMLPITQLGLSHANQLYSTTQKRRRYLGDA